MLLDSLGFFLDEIISELERGAGSLLQGSSVIARQHGEERLLLHRSVADLVREYGLFFECVLEHAEQSGVALSPADSVRLTRCLSNGAAEAVAEFVRQKDAESRRQDFEHFAFIAHELRNPLTSMQYAWELLREQGQLPAGRVGEALGRNLTRLVDLVDRSLIEARLNGGQAGCALHRVRLRLADLLDAVASECATDAQGKGIGVAVRVDPALELHADHRLLFSAVSNIVRNAIKFSRDGATIILRAGQEAGWLRVEVEDECGGLPPARAERLFEAFVQDGDDRSGFGLGLAIAKQAVQLHRGIIQVANLPGQGCVFILQLPLGGH